MPPCPVRSTRTKKQQNDDSLISADQSRSAVRYRLQTRRTKSRISLPDTSNSTAAQIAANQANARHSSGPTTPAGKEKVSQNRRTHGLAGCTPIKFFYPGEDPTAYLELSRSVFDEYQPQTDTEHRLADLLIRHFWLMQRAVMFQNDLFMRAADPAEIDNQKLSLFLRYQATHERSYYKAQRELRNAQKEKQKGDIGFESQNSRQAAEEARTRLANAKAQAIEVDAHCRKVMEAPLPGAHNLSFEELTMACSEAIAKAVCQNRYQAAA